MLCWYANGGNSATLCYKELLDNAVNSEPSKVDLFIFVFWENF